MANNTIDTDYEIEFANNVLRSALLEVRKNSLTVSLKFKVMEITAAMLDRRIQSISMTGDVGYVRLQINNLTDLLIKDVGEDTSYPYTIESRQRTAEEILNRTRILIGLPEGSCDDLIEKIFCW